MPDTDNYENDEVKKIKKEAKRDFILEQLVEQNSKFECKLNALEKRMESQESSIVQIKTQVNQSLEMQSKLTSELSNHSNRVFDILNKQLNGKKEDEDKGKLDNLIHGPVGPIGLIVVAVISSILTATVFGGLQSYLSNKTSQNIANVP